jgi:GntR family transcriptional regulator
MFPEVPLRTSPRRRADRARQVADILRRDVLHEAWPDGILPSEAELVEEFGTTRNTVREALELLRAEGLIERQPGVGTVVVRTKHPHGLDRLRGLAETFHGRGKVHNEVRALGLISPPRAVQSRLGLDPGEDVLHVERLRTLDGQPVSLDVSYLVLDVARRLVGCDLAGSDLFALIEETTGRRLGHADLLVEAVSADAHTAAVLGTVRGAPLLMLERLTHLDDGQPVDLEFIRFRGDRLSLRGSTRRDVPNLDTPDTPDPHETQELR